MKIFTIYTQSGWLAAAWSIAGLKGLVLPQNSCEEALEKLAVKLRIKPSSMPAPEQPRDIEKSFVEDIERYFCGEIVNFSTEIDWSGYTFFQHRILSVVKLIRYGEVYSYKQIAINAGFPKAARAVGGVMRSNRTPLVIPCHRVLAADGSLGGFSEGLNVKKYLLGLEKKSIDRITATTEKSPSERRG